MGRMSKIACLAILIASATFAAAHAQGTDGGSPLPETAQQREARAGITAVIDKVIAMMTRGTNGEELGNTLFTNDALLSVAGDRTYHGLPAMRGLLDEWMKPPFVCQWWVEEPMRISRDGDMAGVNVMERCPGKAAGDAPYYFRMVYVFVRTPTGWKSSQMTVLGPAGENL